ncbi:MAG: S9 family peptidase [Bacteroidetes bacterium]|nr:S9 family peptidase [Bacteroidota bacterium]
MLYITSIEEDSLNRSEINIYDTEKNESKIIWDKAGVTKGLTSDEEGAQFAFYHSEDTAKTKVYSLYYWNAKMDDPELLVDSLTKGMPAGWVVSEKGRLSFSDDGKMLFLATGAKPEVESEEKDSLLADDKVHIDIWHWQDVVLQSMQLKRLSSEKNKTYKAVVHLKKKNFVQLAEKDFLESIRQVNLGHTTRGMASFDKPYELSNAVNFKSVKDIYLTDLTTGDDKMIFEAVEFSPAISTFGNYLYWWEPKDSNYYVYNIDKEKLVCLTEGMDVCFAQRGHDYPSDVGSYGSMGWAKDDESMYLYDEFDIWCFDPAGKNEPINITSGFGRENDLQLRYARLDPEEKFIHPEEDYVFRAFNIETKESGFYRFSLEEASLKKLVMEECGYRLMGKARDAEKLLWTKSTVTEYPDVWISDLSFQSAIKLSEANPQQGDYNWLSVELVEWLDYDGVRHQGLLYKPEDFDPAKKYPMMVYFYRLHSNSLYSHVYPRASSSTINAAFYASNGYLVFMPDVYFKIGQPGRSAFNSIVSGVMSLGKERDYIDMKNLGLQGQSWGGYQAAYIITQTDLFAAASPGAPVSNMTSAYGGIRTSSGMCRQVQYEKTQSRIGGSLWDKPLEYFENSPLFYANQCNTPCLIRHNDNDGAVPFAQGVEFFVALRRLGRPAWLLNYNNGPHNLTKKLSNRKDLSVRMKQFFDHYLMDEPAPAWLDEGVKAIDKKQSETFYMNYTK